MQPLINNNLPTGCCKIQAAFVQLRPVGMNINKSQEADPLIQQYSVLVLNYREEVVPGHLYAANVRPSPGDRIVRLPGHELGLTHPHGRWTFRKVVLIVLVAKDEGEDEAVNLRRHKEDDGDQGRFADF